MGKQDDDSAMIRHQPVPTGADMKTKTGYRILQAVLVMLAMVCGLLLLPGKQVHSATDDCTTPIESDSCG
jgi:hypothetical protein